jgi:16S rRNA U1498 N3-methylase RsmE
MKRKKKKNDQIKDIIKSARKQSREDEIKAHGKPISLQKVAESKKTYKRYKKVNTDENE